MNTNKRYSPEARERAVCMTLDHQGEYSPRWVAIVSIAKKTGCTAEVLQRWVRQVERDEVLSLGWTTEAREQIKALKWKNRELRQAMKAFIDEREETYRVESTVQGAARSLRQRTTSVWPGNGSRRRSRDGSVVMQGFASTSSGPEKRAFAPMGCAIYGVSGSEKARSCPLHGCALDETDGSLRSCARQAVRTMVSNPAAPCLQKQVSR